MSYPQFLRIRVLRLALALASAGLCPAAARAGVTVGLTPASQTVSPGSDFDIFFDVTEAGSPFNGYDVVVDFDPAALTFVPLVPSTNQQGCLMTGGCSAACGNTFHVFSAAGDSLSVSNVLLCNGVLLTGPGHLYKLRFHASNTPQITELIIRRTNFFNAGLYVTPVQKSGCVVGIGINVGVEGPPAAGTGGVRVEPNPSRGRVAFVVDDAVSDVTAIEMLDLQGRIVRRLAPPSPGSGTSIAWDGLDAMGQRVPPGIYLARISRGARVQNARVVLLP